MPHAPSSKGCAYALRDIVDRLDALGLGHGEVRIVGGGARDDLWASIKANVLGRPVRRVLTQEATAVGAAMVAGVGPGCSPISRRHRLPCNWIRTPSNRTPPRRGSTPTPTGVTWPRSTPSSRRWRGVVTTTVPEPNAILADLRERGHDDLPDVDIRVGASVLDGAIADACARPGMPAPVIISDGGPYRTPAGPVVDRLAKQLGCPVIQLGTGTVRADEDTVERAVNRGRLRAAADLRRRGHAHRHREGHRAAHR